jgi:phosphatidate phosphatase APP1
MTRNGGKLAKLRFNVGNVFVLVTRDRDRAFERTIQIRGYFVLPVRVCERLHTANNGGHTLNTIECAVERFGELQREVFQIGGFLGLRDLADLGVQRGRDGPA